MESEGDTSLAGVAAGCRPVTGEGAGDMDVAEGDVGAGAACWLALLARTGVTLPCGADRPRAAGRGDAAFLL